jgi:transposase
VLSTGIARQRLPPELGFGSGMTCWRRLRDWQQAGVWQRLHELLLAKLRQAERLDFSRAVCDSSSLLALLGAVRRTEPRRPRQSRQQALPDYRRRRRPARLPAHGRQPPRRHAAPAARRGDPPVRGKRGLPRRRPLAVLADRAYDSESHRRALHALGIKPILAKRNTRHGSHLGRERWVVERTLSWLHTSTGAFALATSAEPTCTKPSSASHAASSVSNSSGAHFVRGSYTSISSATICVRSMASSDS